MIEYGIEITKQQKPISVTCDVCKKQYYHDNQDDVMEIQEFHLIRFVGGYSSIFGDTSMIKGDICQHCLRDKLGEYLIIVAED